MKTKISIWIIENIPMILLHFLDRVLEIARYAMLFRPIFFAFSKIAGRAASIISRTSA